jgi:hypothetical protein
MGSLDGAPKSVKVMRKVWEMMFTRLLIDLACRP